jgi:hypothetical protein
MVKKVARTNLRYLVEKCIGQDESHEPATMQSCKEHLTFARDLPHDYAVTFITLTP